jgi:hypothetical protein
LTGGGGHRSPAGDEGDHDIGGMAIEVLASAVVDRSGPRIRVPGGDLDITEGNAGIECGHDERRSEHMGVDSTEPCLLADGAHPAVGGSPIQSRSVLPTQDAP